MQEIKSTATLCFPLYSTATSNPQIGQKTPKATGISKPIFLQTLRAPNGRLLSFSKQIQSIKIMIYPALSQWIFCSKNSRAAYLTLAKVPTVSFTVSTKAKVSSYFFNIFLNSTSWRLFTTHTITVRSVLLYAPLAWSFVAP